MQKSTVIIAELDLGEAQLLFSFSPWSTKLWELWESNQKSEHLWGYSNLPLETSVFNSTPSNAPERLEKAGSAVQATNKHNCLAKCSM